MIWTSTETDGDRLVRKRVQEHVGTAEKTVRELRGLANVSDAAKARPRVIEALGTAERLKKQLESLRDD